MVIHTYMITMISRDYFTFCKNRQLFSGNVLPAIVRRDYVWTPAANENNTNRKWQLMSRHCLRFSPQSLTIPLHRSSDHSVMLFNKTVKYVGIHFDNCTENASCGFCLNLKSMSSHLGCDVLEDGISIIVYHNCGKLMFYRTVVDMETIYKIKSERCV